MSDLKKLKTTFSYIKKNKYRVILNKILVNNSITVTDLETNIIIKNDFSLSSGLYDLETIDNIHAKPIDSMSVDDYPVINKDIKTNESVTVTCEILKLINNHSSDDQTRLHLNSVAFDNGYIVATNGYHLKCVELNDKLNKTYLIPNTSIEVLLKLFKSYKLDNVYIKFSDNWAIVENEHFIFQSRLIQRDYIRWQQIIPKSYEHVLDITKWVKFSDIKYFLNKRSNACRLVGIDKEVFFTIPETDIKIKVGDCKDDFEIGFNAKFLDIASENKKSFTIKFNSALAPVLVNDCIVMPLKI